MTFDAIIITDTAIYPEWNRGYGAHRLATHMRENGFSTLVIDFSSALSFETWKEICKYAIGSNTRMLGLSTTWLPYKKSGGGVVNELSKFELEEEESLKNNSFIEDLSNSNYQKWIDIAKAKNKNIKIVVGGPKIDFYLDFPADHFVRGLGETQVIDILTKDNLPKIVDYDRESKAANWSWNNSRTVYTEYDMIKDNEWFTLETSRGCRFKCAFCSYPLIGQKNMMNFMKTKDSLYQELMENYNKYKIVNYKIADDTFNDSTEKLEYLLDVTRRLPFKLNFWAYVRLDVIAVHPQQIEMLKELGIRYAWIGIDSFHPIASKKIGKGMDAERKKQTLLKMRESWGLQTYITTSYIVGLPSEDKSSVLDAYNWLARSDSPVDEVSFIPLRLNPPDVLPNTDKSLMDINYKQYGYNIPDMKKFWEWEKDDDSNICTFNDANQLAYEINQKWEQRPKTREIIFPEYNTINNPVEEYFNPLIVKLKKDL